MPALRRRFNNGTIILSSELEFPTKAAVGRSVAVMMKGDRIENFSFGGFVSAAFNQPVKVKEIEAYTLGDGILDSWIELEKGSVLLGNYDRRTKKVFLIWPLVVLPKH